MSEYRDVFVSHKREDTGVAKKLVRRIRKFGYSCYADYEDPFLLDDEDRDPERVSHRIRTNLRGCTALIFIHSGQAIESKWMPWELGFFDGRWGMASVAIYDVAHQKLPPEYASIYTEVTDENLKEFLHRSTSANQLLTRSDVDIDRLMTLLTGAMRSPIEFYVGASRCVLLGCQKLLSQAAGPSLRPFVEGLFTAPDTLLEMLQNVHSSLLAEFRPEGIPARALRKQQSLIADIVREVNQEIFEPGVGDMDGSSRESEEMASSRQARA